MGLQVLWHARDGICQTSRGTERMMLKTRIALAAASLLVGRPKATENVVTRLIGLLPSQPATLASPVAAMQGGG